MKEIILIAFSLVTITIINYWGHVYPPTSIMLTPFLISIITLACLKVSDLKLIVRLLLIAFFIILNDYLIRTYAGGTHDSAGNAWIILMFMIGSISSFIISIIYVIKRNEELKKSFLYILITTIIIVTYFSTCITYGMVWTEGASKSIEEAMQSEKYLGRLDVSDNLKVRNAWYERTIRINHKRPLQSKETTGQFTYVIEVDSIELAENRQYIILERMTGYNWLNKRVSFRANTEIENLNMILTDGDNIKTTLDTVKIKRP